MKLRTKLLVLLLVIALVPLIASAILHQITMRRLGATLTTDTRRVLEERGTQFLQGRVDEFALDLRRNQATLLLAVEFQAREVEWRLAAHSPGHPSGRSGSGTPPGEAMYLVHGTDPQAVSADVSRLAGLTEVYRQIRDTLPTLVYRQHTALQSGYYGTYPALEVFRGDRDPRQRPWYVRAREAEGLARQVVADEVTGTPLLTLSLPVHLADGSFAGVTAIDVSYDRLFADWRQPERWAGRADSMVVSLSEGGDHPGEIEILLRESLPGTGEDWKIPPAKEFIHSASREELAALQSDVLASRPGIRKMEWNGREALLAYSPGMPGEPFPLLAVPVDLVQAPVEQAETYFREQIRKGLTLYAYLLLAVVAWVIITAYFRSRSVTRPVALLAETAGHYAKEDFGARVDIRTGDELQALGDTFNRMGVQLRERLEMKRSLSLAREIQQMLLPKASPRIPGFEIAGRTIYCDETGGDYFDFIDLGSNRLGIAVGDVTGHGVGAALLMATARGVLRSQAARSGLTIGQLFADLNRHLVEDTSDTLFMTLFYGIIDAESRTLHYVSAGHGPGFLYNRLSGQFTELPSTGIPLGIMPETSYEAGQGRVLTEGEILLVGTDGIWETENPEGELFGIPRLHQAVASAAEGSSKEILASILAAVAGFRKDGPIRDDLTLIVVKS